MKPKFIKVSNTENRSFAISNEVLPNFYNPYHFHPEFELTYVIRSRGIRFVGDHVERFGPGDLVLVGSNVPHCWKNDPEYFMNHSTLKAQAIVLQFREDFAGDLLFRIPEMQAASQLLHEANRGLKFTGSIRPVIKTMLLNLMNSEGTDRILNLLKVLDTLSKHDGRVPLSTDSRPKLPEQVNLERLNTIFEYTTNHYQKEISLGTISSLANMSPNAFCRYFKLHTRKTFKEFVNELRLTSSCRELKSTDKGIGEIAYANGFNNLSHFNRTFRKVMNMSPSDYRRQFNDLEFFTPPGR